MIFCLISQLARYSILNAPNDQFPVIHSYLTKTTSNFKSFQYLLPGNWKMAWRLTLNQHSAEDIFCSLKKVSTLKYGFAVRIAHDLMYNVCELINCDLLASSRFHIFSCSSIFSLLLPPLGLLKSHVKRHFFSNL